MSDGSKVGITSIITATLIILSLIGGSIAKTVQGNVETTKRMESCVTAGSNWKLSDEDSIRYVCVKRESNE